MQKMVEEAYVLFAPYEAKMPLHICSCGSCSPEDFQRKLLHYPLQEIPSGILEAYLSSVPLEDEAATARDMKHFLPRILQALVNGEDVRTLDEVLLDKLRCDLPECWFPHEIEWLHRFAAAWFESQLDTPRYESCLGVWLTMFHFAGLDVTDRLLALWVQYADHLPALREFVGLYLNVPYGSNDVNWYKTCYLPLHCRRREYLAAKLSAWFTSPSTRTVFRRALEDALLAGRETSDETLCWEQCYDWLA